jgi:hypothetical protein
VLDADTLDSVVGEVVTLECKDLHEIQYGCDDAMPAALIADAAGLAGREPGVETGVEPGPESNIESMFESSGIELVDGPASDSPLEEGAAELEDESVEHRAVVVETIALDGSSLGATAPDAADQDDGEAVEFHFEMDEEGVASSFVGEAEFQVEDRVEARGEDRDEDDGVEVARAETVALPGEPELVDGIESSELAASGEIEIETFRPAANDRKLDSTSLFEGLGDERWIDTAP